METERESHERLMLAKFGPAWRLLTEPHPKPSTPPRITWQLRKFAEVISGPAAVARYVDVYPWGPFAMCHLNTRDYSAQHGGKVVFGWILWVAGDFIAAEFHSVIEKDGQMYCVTASRGDDKLVFVPDLQGRVCSWHPYNDKYYEVHDWYNVPLKDPVPRPQRVLSPVRIFATRTAPWMGPSS